VQWEPTTFKVQVVPNKTDHDRPVYKLEIDVYHNANQIWEKLGEELLYFSFKDDRALTTKKVLVTSNEDRDLDRLKNITNCLKNLIDCLKNLYALKELVFDFEGCNLTYIPENIVDLRRVTNLTFKGIQNDKMPDFLMKCTQLKHFSWCANYTKIIPYSLGQLTNLKTLDLNLNYFDEIPSSFQNLTNLKKLNLEDNAFYSFPDVLEQLTELEELNLNDNFVTSVPSYITSLKKLNCLEVCCWEGAEEDDIKNITTIPLSFLPWFHEKQSVYFSNGERAFLYTQDGVLSLENLNIPQGIEPKLKLFLYDGLSDESFTAFNKLYGDCVTGFFPRLNLIPVVKELLPQPIWEELEDLLGLPGDHIDSDGNLVLEPLRIEEE
jgi:hypothetical protein